MRNFHVFPRIVLATVPTLLLMVSAACHNQVPEQAVRAQLAALQAAMDARDATAVRDLLATDFIGEQGLEKRGAHQLAAGLFLRYREVSAKIGPIQVEVLDPSNAIARFNLLATGGSGGLLPDSGQVFAVETGWQYIVGHWLLRNASWKPAL